MHMDRFYNQYLLKAPVWKLLDCGDVVKNWVLPLLVICESTQLKCHLGLVKVCRANPEGANVTAQCTNQFGCANDQSVFTITEKALNRTFS